MIHCKCEECGNEFEAHENAAGHEVICTACGVPNVVPDGNRNEAEVKLPVNRRSPWPLRLLGLIGLFLVTTIPLGFLVLSHDLPSRPDNVILANFLSAAIGLLGGGGLAILLPSALIALLVRLASRQAGTIVVAALSFILGTLGYVGGPLNRPMPSMSD